MTQDEKKKRIMRILEAMVDDFVNDPEYGEDFYEVILLIQGEEQFAVNVFPSPPSEDVVALIEEALEIVSEQVEEGGELDEENIIDFTSDFFPSTTVH